MPIKKKLKSLSFQEIVMNLQKFWGKNDCILGGYSLLFRNSYIYKILRIDQLEEELLIFSVTTL